jgi:uncharacterized membrane protein YoaT (DUF817 family)
MNKTKHLEQTLGHWVRARVPFVLAEFIMFGLKQAWAAIFGGLILSAIIITKYTWPIDASITRYDGLFIISVTIQLIMLAFGLETKAEAKMILIFHITGTVMEIFKVSAGSWIYPENSVFMISGVPLFSGFMYASVGSYIARVMRVFQMQFASFPPLWQTWTIAVLIYVNFFAHHFMLDMRYALMFATVMIFGKTKVWFLIGRNWYWMPFPIAGGLASFFLWIAENVGTRTQTWLYSSADGWQNVNFAKMGSWYLLLYVAFATVTLTIRENLTSDALNPRASRQ